MGARLQLLILLLALCWPLTAPASAVGAGCLDCHGSHYEEGGGCALCHQGIEGTGRVEIAHHRLIAGRLAFFNLEGSPVVKRGERLLESSACRRCHVVAGKGNRLAANLDRSPNHRGPEDLLKALKEPALFMPRFRFAEQQAVEQINAILAAAAKAPPAAEEAPQVVHFTDLVEAPEDLFSKNCGACHRLLSKKEGGLGRGDAGPNLSGLFSAHYPANFGEGERWTAENLLRWVERPRKVRPFSRMTPVGFSREEARRLLEVFR